MNTSPYDLFLKKKRHRLIWMVLSCLLLCLPCVAQQADSLEQSQGFTIFTDSNAVPLGFTSLNLDPALLPELRKLPYSYTGQALNGKIAGLQAVRRSGEPGVAPWVFLRGLSMPIGSQKDVYANRPLWVINGIPLMRNDHPYQLAIRKYDFGGIGSGIDINALIDINNINDIQVIKGAEAVALYGADAANGAVVLRTRPPQEGRYHIGFNLYGGVALAPAVNGHGGYNMINGAYMKDLMLPFFQAYATGATRNTFPAYLSDSTSTTYFGPSNWNELYYRNALQHGAGVNITGGNARANFRFGVGEHTEEGVADQTGLERYNVYYDMYIVPLARLNIRTYVQAATATRSRNHSLRERFAAMDYFPDQEYPLPPNKQFLQTYYQYLNQGNDQNQVNSIQGVVRVQYVVRPELSLNSQFSVDYNDNHRDYFVPAVLNDGNSFNSYFSSVNRRIYWKNFASFNKVFSGDSRLQLGLGQSLEFNRMQYGYIKGYRGPSDFVKVIEVDNEEGTWLTHDKNLVYAYKDYLQQNLVSAYGHISYGFRDKYTATVFLRTDGSSYFGNGYKWAVSPLVSLNWNLKKESFLKSSSWLDDLSVYVTAGRSVRYPSDDYYGFGPYYTEDIGWAGSEKVSTYASFPALGLSFTNGFVGSSIRAPYTDQWNAGFQMKLAGAWQLQLDLYSRTDKELLMSIPTGGAAYGFSGQWLNGMDVRNSGMELTLGGNFSLSHDLTWETGLIAAYNRNKLLRLPDGLQTLTYGQRHLEVGKSVDQFWLLQNAGIYEKEEDIPLTEGGQKISYNGIPFEAGDPKWTDRNGDGLIDDDDRVMQGHILPFLHGGWNNRIRYKRWTLGFSLIYALGKHSLNGAVAHRFDFANREGASGLDGVKELTYWAVKGNLNSYPRYNPWSLVHPYQTDQTLFYERSDFVKLQSVVLQYDLTSLPLIQKAGLSKLQVYLSGTNLYTATPYGGGDPALTDDYGYDYHYGLPLPVTLTLGIHADF